MLIVSAFHKSAIMTTIYPHVVEYQTAGRLGLNCLMDKALSRSG
ncbi:hypothetical protein HMPREF1870_01772 [Bacteroidales bacterium KA00344]|nr:hypothetical protein HMPREF1870_01772 [Bacteroidales bacterium KA00344]